MSRLLALWVPVVITVAIIFGLSHLSRPPRPPALPDWFLHGIEFAVLGFFLLRALAGGLRRRARTSHVLAALALAVVLGVSDEIHQGFVPERTVDIRDMMADGAGAAAGIALALAGSRLVVAAWSEPRPVSVRLLTGPDCGLCGEARDVLRHLARRFPLELEEISIREDPDLESRYRLEVPVILIDGRRVSKGRVNESRLAASLAARCKEKRA